MEIEWLPKIVVALGLVPMVVCSLRKETHYTQFWDAFWNLYGLILICVGIMFDTTTLIDFIYSVIAISLIVLFIYYVFKYQKHKALRKVGSSKIVLSLTVAVLALFYLRIGIWAIIGGIVCWALLTAYVYFKKKKSQQCFSRH